MPTAGAQILLRAQLAKADTGRFVKVSVRDSTNAAIAGSPVTLTHVADGLYTDSSLVMPSGNVYAQYEVYTDAGLTTTDKKYLLTEELFPIVDVLDTTVETGFSLKQSLRLILAALSGKLSGAPGTTITIRDVNDTKNRIIATVDADGNRTAVTTDVS